MKAFRICTIALLMVLFILVFNETSFAQCAMCKGAISDKVSNGESNLGEGLNKGILYLMSFPYIILGAIAYFWHRESKKNKKK
jgi:hypothetical protein